MQFHANVERIYSGLSFADVPLKRKEIEEIIRQQSFAFSKKRINRTDKLEVDKKVIGYKKGLDYIRKDWYVTNKKVDLRAIKRIQNLLSRESYSPLESTVMQVLDYLQTSSDNPVIQAAIAKFAFLSIFQISIEKDIVSTLYSYLFLYKAGYDFRNMLVLERQFLLDKQQLVAHYNEAMQKQNLISWIEYFATSLKTDLLSILDSLAKTGQTRPSEDHFTVLTHLNKRQFEILNLLDDPVVMVTNRMIQKKFKISQITASRDLSKMAALGLLFQYGKGRSVRYSRV